MAQTIFHWSCLPTTLKKIFCLSYVKHPVYCTYCEIPWQRLQHGATYCNFQDFFLLFFFSKRHSVLFNILFFLSDKQDFLLFTTQQIDERH